MFEVPTTRCVTEHAHASVAVGILTQLFERALAVIENQGEQHPAKDPEMTRLNTAKNGLELVERIVYVDGDACERPHGLGSCVVLGFRHLPRYTGAIIFPVLVRGLTLVPPPTHPSLLRTMGFIEEVKKANRRVKLLSTKSRDLEHSSHEK